MTDDHDGYVFRFYCDPCRCSSGWHETPDKAEAAAEEHCETHDELLYEPTRVQRYPEDDPVVVQDR